MNTAARLSRITSPTDSARLITPRTWPATAIPRPDLRPPERSMADLAREPVMMAAIPPTRTGTINDTTPSTSDQTDNGSVSGPDGGGGWTQLVPDQAGAPDPVGGVLTTYPAPAPAALEQDEQARPPQRGGPWP